MRRWNPRLDWEHLKNWVPGAVGISLVILMLVVAANSRTETNSRPAEMPSSQSTQVATNGQKGTAAPPSQPAAPQSSSVADKPAKVPAPATPPPAAATSDAAKPAPMHDHAMVKAEAVTAPAPVQGSVKPDKEPQKADAASPQGDAVAGRQVFKKCQACHSLDPGKTILGPSLAGIVGRKSGAEPDFNYSPAMKQAALTWDAATLDSYLMDPQKVVPGNRMPFPGLKTDHDRKDVIAFLAAPASPPVGPAAAKAAAPAASATAAPQAQSSNPAYLSDAKYTLRTGIAEGKMVFLGVGGSIDGKANPVLTAAEGQIVQLTLINGRAPNTTSSFPTRTRSRHG